MSLVNEENGVYANALGMVGHTPLIKLNRVSAHLKCEVYVKCEFFNAGGSVKDRIGKRMLQKGLEDGKFKKGDTLIEPTSGNTGIGLALAAAVEGLDMIATMPKKMSLEKIAVLKALGARAVRTPTEAAFDDFDSHINVANRMQKELPNAHIPDQYTNEHNPLAHYEGTAEELLKQTGGKIDMLVAGAGTGGTITGIAKKLKEKIPGIKIVGVDPKGSILGGTDDHVGGYQVEGIGYDFFPDVLDRSVVDKWYKSDDKPSFLMARRLIREEGLLCGGSCGCAAAYGLMAAEELEEGQVCVIVLPDSIRNYISKFADDRWMFDNGYMDPPQSELFGEATAAELELKPAATLSPDAPVSEVLRVMRESGVKAVPLVDADGLCAGLVTHEVLYENMAREGANKDTPAKDVALATYRRVPASTTLNRLQYTLEMNNGVAVIADMTPVGKYEFQNVVTVDDVFAWVQQKL
eukprot:TRINITY_DN562_c0_g1_i1.p1 TRINITY_DN562_c0_g1~~TRINITY_DN562_c0_g1_i1.p1  ORF type:complete len:465 (-),score=207.07 TRINITY_DN562_c0_g1_i1:381-1775(-)